VRVEQSQRERSFDLVLGVETEHVAIAQAVFEGSVVAGIAVAALQVRRVDPAGVVDRVVERLADLRAAAEGADRRQFVDVAPVLQLHLDAAVEVPLVLRLAPVHVVVLRLVAQVVAFEELALHAGVALVAESDVDPLASRIV
jgi:hypothetical protein